MVFVLEPAFSSQSSLPFHFTKCPPHLSIQTVLKFPQLTSRRLDSWFIKPVSSQGPWHLLLICDTARLRAQAYGAQSTPDASEEGLAQDLYGERDGCDAEQKPWASAPPCTNWLALGKRLAPLCLFCFVCTGTALPQGECTREARVRAHTLEVLPNYSTGNIPVPGSSISTSTISIT